MYGSPCVPLTDATLVTFVALASTSSLICSRMSSAVRSELEMGKHTSVAPGMVRDREIGGSAERIGFPVLSGLRSERSVI